MPSFSDSQNWDEFDPSNLPPISEALATRLQAVAAHLKEVCGSDGFHGKRAALVGDDYWLDLASSMPNHPGVDLPLV